jgi:UrcA family protein
MRAVLLAVCLVAATVGTAFAQDAENGRARAVPVRFSDLDPTESADAAALLRRLHLAAQRACAIDELQQPGPSARRAIAACERDAVAISVARLGRPEVMRLHEAELRR